MSMDYILTGVTFVIPSLLLGALIGLLIAGLTQTVFFKNLPQTLASLILTLALALIFARVIWRTNDFFGWGLCIIPPLLAGATFPTYWKKGYRFDLIFVFVLQAVFGALAISQFVNRMDGLGYSISYWHAQLRYNPYAVDKVLENFDAEIDTVIVYLVVASCLLFIPYLFLPLLGHLKKACRARVQELANS